MDTPQGTQEVSHGGPHALARVDVHFADAIPIVVTRPFLLAVADRRVAANDVVVALPFVGEYHGLSQGEGMDVVNQRCSVGVGWTTRKRTCPLSRPTVPTTGGRSLA
jgi:hypothetical protein